jgi:hypothetical protein
MIRALTLGFFFAAIGTSSGRRSVFDVLAMSALVLAGLKALLLGPLSAVRKKRQGPIRQSV